MQKVIRSRKKCSNRLITPNIRNLQYFGLEYQFSAYIHTYNQDLWEIYARENSFFDGFITHSPTISSQAAKEPKPQIKQKMDDKTQHKSSSYTVTIVWVWLLLFIHIYINQSLFEIGVFVQSGKYFFLNSLFLCVSRLPSSAQAK